MTTSICVRILGANGNYMTADEVDFTFDSQRVVTLKGAQPGDATRYVATITETPPTGVLIAAKKAQYYDTSQHFAITVDANGKPTLKKDQTLAPYVDEAYAAYQPDSTKPDWNVDVNMYLGQLLDVTAKVNQLAAVMDPSINIQPEPFTFSAVQFNQYQSTILSGSTDPGWGRFNVGGGQPSPSGKIVFLERSTDPNVAPKLYLVWLPSGAESGDTQFNVFLHPFVHTPPQDTYPADMSQYPYHARHIDMLHYYGLHGAGFIYQQALTGKKVVLVLPTGSSRYQMANIPSSAGMLQLLVELKFWLTRVSGFAKGTKIGRCGVTAFSFGGANLESLFASCAPGGSFGGTFYNSYWRELILFDPVPNDKDGFISKLKKWHAGGKDGRNYRIYTQNNIGWDVGNVYSPLAQALTGKTETPGPDGAKEAEAGSSGTGGASVLFTPLKFWNGMWQNFTPQYGTIHVTFPHEFYQHALANSSFT
jgi:hypothetical protein